MTICIASLYKNGAGCILVSDRMVKGHFPMGYEYENKEVGEILEIEHPGPLYILTSGSIFLVMKLLKMPNERQLLQE